MNDIQGIKQVIAEISNAPLDGTLNEAYIRMPIQKAVAITSLLTQMVEASETQATSETEDVSED